MQKAVLSPRTVRQPFQKVYALGHEGSQKAAETKSGVELWVSFHANTPSSGKMAAEATQAASFIWGSVLLPVCPLNLAFL